MMVAVSCPLATTPPAPGVTPYWLARLTPARSMVWFGAAPAMALTSMLVTVDAPLPVTVKCR
ncbi:hypothetical protein D9M73_298940 [compost metagenome]